MRILYILTSLGMGGAERQALALAARMFDRGHSVEILSLRQRLPQEWPTSLPVSYLGLRRTPWGLLSLVLCLLHGAGSVLRFRPALIHSHGFHANIVARLLWLFSPGTKLVCTIHNVYEGGWHRMMAYRLTSFLVRKTTFVSQAAQDRFERLRAVKTGKGVTLPNGIDTGEFEPRAERRASVRMQKAVSGNFVWLAAGRIVPAKDYPNLLRAFARIRLIRSDVRLWIAAEAAGIEFEQANKLIAELGLQDFVSWLGLCRDMPALFDAADGFVLSSTWEGMPLVIGEAMAMEKLVVATDVGGVRELLGDAGSVVSSCSPRALAQAMLDSMQMPPAERRALGCIARQRVAGSFSMDAIAERWEAIYLSIS